MLTIWLHSVTAGFQIGPAVARIRMVTSEITLRVCVLFPNVEGTRVEVGLFQSDALLEAVETSELLRLISLYCSMVRVGETVVILV